MVWVVRVVCRFGIEGSGSYLRAPAAFTSWDLGRPSRLMRWSQTSMIVGWESGEGAVGKEVVARAGAGRVLGWSIVVVVVVGVGVGSDPACM